MQMELVANDAATDTLVDVDAVAIAVVAATVAGTAAWGGGVSRSRKQIQAVVCCVVRLFISHYQD